MASTLSKDLAEHLRTVHFSLIVLCLALLVIAGSDSAQDVRLARRQLKQIAGVTAESKWDVEYVARELSKQLAGTWEVKSIIDGKSVVAQEGRGMVIPPGGLARIHLDKRREPDFLVKFERPYWFGGLCCDGGELKSAPHSLQGDSDVIMRPENLRAFKQLWDRLLKRDVAHVPRELDLLYMEGKALPFDRANGLSYSIAKAANVNDSDVVWAGITSITGSGGSGETRFYQLRRPSRSDDGYLLPVLNESQYRIDSQSILATLDPDWKLQGTFSYAFAELDALTKATDTLDFATIDTILAEEEKRAVASFEAFGVKFPAGSTLQWGILLILATQCYLLIHLFELRPRLQTDPEGLSVAWVGLYKTRTAQLVIATTLVALPALSLSVLYFKSKHSPATLGPVHFVAESTSLLVIVILAVCASVAVALRSVLLLRTILARSEAAAVTKA